MEVPFGPLKWVLSTEGAQLEVFPLGIPKEVTRKRADPTKAMALPNGEPDRVLELPNAKGRVVNSTLDLGQDGTHAHPAKGAAGPSGVPNLRPGKDSTVMGLMALPAPTTARFRQYKTQGHAGQPAVQYI